MVFDFQVNKLANYYFFIQNLSLWHPSTRPKHNDYWQEITGKVNKEEKELLKKFSDLHCRYSFGGNYLGRHFFLQDDPWDSIYQLPNDDAALIRETFDTFRDKFEKLYSKEEESLSNWQKKLKQGSDAESRKIVADLNTLYGSNVNNPHIKVFLLFSSPMQSGGGANIDNLSITVEVSQQQLHNLPNMLGLIWHETVHLLFEKQSYLSQVREIYKDDDSVNLIKESTNCALFPHGALAQEHFPHRFQTLHNRIPATKNEDIMGLAITYLKEKKGFDSEFIRSIYELTKDLKGMLR